MESKKNKVRNENYYKIAGWMVNELNLKSVPLMVYAIIYGFSQDGESEYSGNRQYLCDFTGTTKPTIDKALKELCDSNLIIKISETKNSITFNKYKVNLDVLDFTTSKETLPVSDKETLSGGSKETLPNNNGLNNNNLDNNGLNNKEKNIINNKKENFDEIFDYWNDAGICHHREKTPLMLKAYNKAIKDYGLNNEQIKLAIDHYKIMMNDRNCWLKQKWSLAQFLKQENACVNLTDEGSFWVNYNSPKIVKQGLVNAEIVRPRRNDNDII